MDSDINVLYRGPSLLREIPARQVPGEPARRWFMSAHCDLIVWTHGEGAPLAFQFCYDKDWQEHALTWTPGGFSHCTVESGGVGPIGKGTPLLAVNGSPDVARILDIFRVESEAVPPAFTEFVIAKLELMEVAAPGER